MTTYLTENDDDATRDLLLGRRITAVKLGAEAGDDAQVDGQLTLDDGTVVDVVPNDGGCSCGAGDYVLTHLATVDNVITDVRLAVDEGSDGEAAKTYRIFVYAGNEEINVMTVDGDDGNGYYGTGYALHVKHPGQSGS
jgi:hypothetical protein